MRPTVQKVISDNVLQNNELDLLSVKSTARGSFPATALEYKTYNLAPEYILARRMKEYLYHPGRTTDVKGVVPDYLCDKFERMYVKIQRPSPMQTPPETVLQERRMIDAAQAMFTLERSRRSVSAQQRSAISWQSCDLGDNQCVDTQEAPTSISLSPSPARSPDRRGKHKMATRSPTYPDSISGGAQPYFDEERDVFLAMVEAGQDAHYFRVTPERALPCSSVNAAVATMIHLSRRFYAPCSAVYT